MPSLEESGLDFGVVLVIAICGPFVLSVTLKPTVEEDGKDNVVTGYCDSGLSVPASAGSRGGVAVVGLSTGKRTESRKRDTERERTRE